MNKHRNPDGTYDGVGVMSEISGLTRSTVTDLWAEVKANHALLDTCPRHDFASTEPGRLGAKWKCSACGGLVSAVDAGWYQKGLAHGGR